MPIIAANKGGSFVKAPEGVHRAVCVGVIDLGSQPGFEGVGTQRKVMLQWELSDELMDDGRPFMVSEEYTLSLNEKANLRKKLDAWRGKPFTEEEMKGFDLANLLGKPCQLQVTHQTSKTSGKSFAKVTSIMPLMKGMQAPEPINTPRQFAIDDPAIPEGLPEWIVNKINASEERRPAGAPVFSGPAHAAPARSAIGDDSTPF